MNTSFSKTSLLLLLLLGLTGIPPSSAANTTIKERCHPHDKRALLQIKQQSFQNSTLLSWDPNTDCCTGWSSVGCDASTNRVTSFSLLFSDTEATPFPSALGDLPYLEAFIFHNEATGRIPNSLAKLHRIVRLDLSINRLTGPIPSFLSRLKRLTYLDLSHNKLSGEIPPALALAPSLVSLQLNRNRLTGPIPESFGSFKNKNVDLSLSDNKLSGEIPRSLGNVNFSSFQVAGNKLKGDASFLFGKHKAVWDLDLSGNSFSFDMSGLEIPHGMNVMDLSRNRIYGSLPAGLANLPELNSLNVSNNRLCGLIPTGGTLKLFDKTSYFHNKCLCGTPLPSCKGSVDSPAVG